MEDPRRDATGLGALFPTGAVCTGMYWVSEHSQLPCAARTTDLTNQLFS